MDLPRHGPAGAVPCRRHGPGRPAPAGVTPAEIRARAARGRRVVIPLDPGLTMPAVMAAARDLRADLPPDLHVIGSPPAAGRGPVLTVLRLVSDAEVAALRPALGRLVAEFRQTAGALVTLVPDGDEPATVRFGGTTWHVEPHGGHCRFEADDGGVVVEACVDDPGSVDPYFLLLYARTSGRHGAVVDACVEGFHDMCRLLDALG